MGERKGKRVTHDAGFGPSFRRVTMRIIEMRDGVEIVAERLVTGFEAAAEMCPHQTSLHQKKRGKEGV